MQQPSSSSSKNNSAPQIVWKPKNTKSTNIWRFISQINNKFSLQLETYDQLYQWSCENIYHFWEQVYSFCGIITSQAYTCVIDKSIPMSQIPKWFSGSKLNFAENLLRYRDNKVAIEFRGENGSKSSLTYNQLFNQVEKAAAALKKLGVQKDDRVGGYIANTPHAVIAMLATTSIGAIWSSTAPDFGVSGVLDRFSQIAPKIIFSQNGVSYNNKVHSHWDKLTNVVKGLKSLQSVVIFRFAETLDTEEEMENHVKQIHSGGVTWEQFLKLGALDDGSYPPLQFEQTDFSQPVYILYSSGTTGKPKCIVHSAGGTLIQHLKEHVILADMNRNDVAFYYSSCGWMMWNFLVSYLAVGCTMVLFDGSPFAPKKSILWDIADELGMTIFGTSAKYLQALEQAGLKPRETHTLSKLRMILSTGSPLLPTSFDFVYRDIKSDVILGSISGGTDIISCFVGCNPISPIYRGQIMNRNLGMAVESWDEFGKPVTPGLRGELVCTKPFPSMPVSFWNDLPNNIHTHPRYHSAYFSKYPNVWAHGDFIIIEPESNGITILGRSDATLNPGGIRFGSGEIYSVLEKVPEISDSLVIGKKLDPNAKSGHVGDEKIVLFLQMKDGVNFSADIVKKVKSLIRSQLSARHVPGVVLETKDIPHTLSGKKVEIAVKRLIHGETIKNESALRNPESLDFYKTVKIP